MEYQYISALTTSVVDSLSNRYFWNIPVYKKHNADHFSENIFFFNYPECILIPEVKTTGTQPKYFQISKLQSNLD